MIRTPEIRVVDADGNQLGIMKVADAIRAAEQAELDLVEVAPKASPPVCRIMDYSKFKYDQAKKEKEARKKQKVIHVKEIKLHPHTDQHDYDFKKKHIEKFIQRGDKVKVTMVYRGREKQNMEIGLGLLDKLSLELAPIAEVESAPKREFNTINMIFAPKH